MENMNPCSDASSFYALVRPACGRDLSSAECRKAVSGGVDKFGIGCLGLPITEGNIIFPPFVGYVCDNASGRLGQQCGQYMPAPTSAGTGTGTETGTGAAAAIGTIGALSGATLYGMAQKARGMHRKYDKVDEHACLANRLMCITDTDLDEIFKVDEGGSDTERQAMGEFTEIVKQARHDFYRGGHQGAASESLVLQDVVRQHVQRHLEDNEIDGAILNTRINDLDRHMTAAQIGVMREKFPRNPYISEKR